jgi:hypothetical protein
MRKPPEYIWIHYRGSPSKTQIGASATRSTLQFIKRSKQAVRNYPYSLLAFLDLRLLLLQYRNLVPPVRLGEIQRLVGQLVYVLLFQTRSVPFDRRYSN